MCRVGFLQEGTRTTKHTDKQTSEDGGSIRKIIIFSFARRKSEWFPDGALLSLDTLNVSEFVCE